jgi:hypothetical protein
MALLPYCLLSISVTVKAFFTDVEPKLAGRVDRREHWLFLLVDKNENQMAWIISIVEVFGIFGSIIIRAILYES